MPARLTGVSEQPTHGQAKPNPPKLQETAQKHCSGKVETAETGRFLHLFPGVISPGHSTACLCLFSLSNTIVCLSLSRELSSAELSKELFTAPSRTFPLLSAPVSDVQARCA